MNWIMESIHLCDGMTSFVLFGGLLAGMWLGILSNCWNHAKRSKALHQQTIPLVKSYHHMVVPQYLEEVKRQTLKGKILKKTRKAYADRILSFSSLSSLEDILLLLPQEAAVLDAPSADPKPTAESKNDDLLDQPTGFCGSFSFSFQKSKVEPLVPHTPVKDFVGDLDSLDLQSTMQQADEWSEKSDEKDHEISSGECGQVGPRTACHCQVFRSVSQWSAGASQPEESIHNNYCSLIEKHSIPSS